MGVDELVEGVSYNVEVFFLIESQKRQQLYNVTAGACVCPVKGDIPPSKGWHGPCVMIYYRLSIISRCTESPHLLLSRLMAKLHYKTHYNITSTLIIIYWYTNQDQCVFTVPWSFVFQRSFPVVYIEPE